MRGFCLLITLYVKPTNSSGLQLTAVVLAPRFRFKHKLTGWQLSSNISTYGAMDEIPEENASQSWSQLLYLNPVWRATAQVQLLQPGLGRWQLPPGAGREKVRSNSHPRLSTYSLKARAASYTLLKSHLDTGFERWADLPLSLGILKESPHELQEKSCRKGLGVNICHAERKASVQVGSL